MSRKAKPPGGVGERGLGMELRHHREKAGLSLEKVGAVLGWSANTMSRLERGLRPDTTTDEVSAILAAIGVMGADRDRTMRMARGELGAWWEKTNADLSDQARTYLAFERRASRVIDRGAAARPGAVADCRVHACGADRARSEQVADPGTDRAADGSAGATCAPAPAGAGVRGHRAIASAAGGRARCDGQAASPHGRPGGATACLDSCDPEKRSYASGVARRVRSAGIRRRGASGPHRGPKICHLSGRSRGGWGV